MDEIETKVAVKATRTNCITEVEREVECYLKLGQGLSGLCLYLLGGPTGYEGLVINENSMMFFDLSVNGWWACAGTKGRWDSLFVPGAEIERAFRELGLCGVVAA